MSAKRRKQGRRTIREVGSAPARAVQADRAAASGASYPTAVELVATGDAWRNWLDEALRCVLAPAALAGAIGVAAAGCGTGAAALEAFGASPVATAPRSAAQPLSAFGPAVSAKPPAGDLVASLSPLGPPSAPPPIGRVPVPVVNPEPPPVGPVLPPVRPVPPPAPPMVRGRMAYIPPTPPVQPVQPVRPRRPAPPVQPIADLVAMAGGMRSPDVVPAVVPRPDPPAVVGQRPAVEP